MKCTKCGKELMGQEAFCGDCGTPVAKVGNDVQNIENFLHWNVWPGEVARKLDQAGLGADPDVKGIIIQEGTKALIFFEGKLITEARSGRYEFRPQQVEEVKRNYERQFGESDREKGRKGGGLEQREEGVAGAIKVGWKVMTNFFLGTPLLEQIERLGKIPPKVFISRETALAQKAVSIVLMRDAEFEVSIPTQGVQTAEVRCDIDSVLFLEILDPMALYRSFLVDTDFLSQRMVAERLKPLMGDILHGALGNSRVEEISHDMNLRGDVLRMLNESLSRDWPFFRATKIHKLISDRKEFLRFREQNEELFFAEKDLEQVVKRNEFQNRLAMAGIQKQVADARNELELKKLMRKVNQDELVSDDEMEKFELALMSEKELRAARTENEKAAALAGLKKSGLLRDDEIHALERNIRDKHEDHDLNRSHVLSMLQISRNLEADKEKLRWEYEIGDKRIEIELERRRKQYLAGIEERKIQIGLDKAEQITQLEILKQAQEIRMAKERAEFEQAREMKNLEAQKLLEMQRLYANMTPEQIMMANPSLSPEAAKALAEKFKAETANKSAGEMKDFMEKQMDLMRDLAKTGATASAEVLKAKDEEIKRTNQMVDRNEERQAKFVSGTVDAIAGSAAALRKCANCGTDLKTGDAFCSKCGQPVKA